MIQNIQEMFALMLNETKRSALRASVDALDNINSEQYIRQRFIIDGDIPEKHQQKLVEIFQNALKNQNSKAQKLIES